MTYVLIVATKVGAEWTVEKRPMRAKTNVQISQMGWARWLAEGWPGDRLLEVQIIQEESP